MVENEGKKIQPEASRDHNEKVEDGKAVEDEAEVAKAVKRSFDPRTDNMLNIPDE